MGHDSVWVVLLGAVVQLALGVVLGRWWAPLLFIGVVLLAVPAGYPQTTDGSDPLPLWFGMLFAGVFAVPIALVGVIARKIYVWRTRSRSAPRAT